MCRSRCVSTPTTKSSSSASIPTDPPASLVGSSGAGLSARKPQRQDCKESRPQGGQAPDQASSGRQTGAAAHTQTNHSQGTHTAASHPTSHTRHGDNQAGNGPRQSHEPTLTVPRREAASRPDGALGSVSAVPVA